MRGNFCAFNGLVGAQLVRHGADYKLHDGANTFAAVYGEMLRQIARDYNGLPDARTLTASDILFFYDGLRAELRAHTAPD